MPLHPLIRGALAALLLATLPALAGDPAGKFDFYVLSLSWTPTWCATDAKPDDRSCQTVKRRFEVHGFWPEFERGYPQDCESGEPQWLDRRIHDRVADIMPSLGLAGYQWRKHGICAGLSQSDYFALMRRAFDAVKVPAILADPATELRLSPAKVEEAFVAANPGLSTGALAVTCRQGMLDEVRVCLTKALAVRPCPEVDRDACPLSTVRVPNR